MTPNPPTRSDTPPESRTQGWLIIALILGLAAALFHPVRSFEFLNFDDELYVGTNPWLRQGFTAKSVDWAFTAHLTHFSQRAEYWSPITLLTRLFDGQFFGLEPGGHHVTSAILHALNAVILFFAIRSLTGATCRAGVVALIFLVHPQNLEPVAWLSARKDVVNGTFFFLTLWAYGWFSQKPGRWRYVILLLAFLGGCMAKPMAVSVPFILLLLDFWPLQRWRRDNAVQLLMEKLPLAIIAGVIAGLAVMSQKEWGALQSSDHFSIGTRVANALVSYATYFRRVFWPNDLAIYYPHPGAALPVWHAVVAAIFLVAMTAVALLLARRAGYVVVGWLWFGISLGPVIGLVQIGQQAMADRYMYPAGVGIFIALVWSVANCLGSRPRMAVAVSIAAIAGLTVVAARQLQTWRDSVTVFTRALAVTKNNEVAFLNLGSAYYVRGDRSRAFQLYQQSLKIRPVQPKAWNNLAAVANDLGRETEAMQAYEIAVQLNPGSAKSQFYFGKLLLKNGRLEEGEMRLRRAIELEPGWPDPYLELGRWLSTQERWSEAGKMVAAYLILKPADQIGRELMQVIEARRTGG